jgi:hypothetical protein
VERFSSTIAFILTEWMRFMARVDRSDRLWRELDEVIAEQDVVLTSNSGVHDGTPLIKALAPFRELLGETALVGFYHRPGGEISVVRSASFLISSDLVRTLEPIEDREALGRDVSAVEVADFFLKDSGECFNVELEHVYCRFSPKASLGAAGQKSLTGLANLYQRFFLDSRNLENYMDGVVYWYARPGDRGGLHPRFSTFPEIADAIKNAFSINASYLVFTGSRDRNYQPRPADFPTRDNQPLSETLSFSGDTHFLRKLGLAVQLKQSIVGSTNSGEYYSIHPASDSTVRKSPVDGLLIVWSDRPISVMCYRAAATWLREFSVRRHLERVRFLNRLRFSVEQQVRMQAEAHEWGRRDRHRAVVALAQLVCEQLCALTNAESVSFRMHEPVGDVVRQYARHNTALGDYLTTLPKGEMAPDIPLANWRKSAIAFAFRSKSPDLVLHIGDMKQLPAAYQEEGLRSVTQSRPDSRSEAIIRIRQGGLIMAVFNLESPVEGALITDVEFLRECGDVMSDYLTRLDTFSDRPALAEIASTHIALHAVKGFVKRWEPGNIEEALYIAERLKSHMFGRDRAEVGDRFEFGGRVLNIANRDGPKVLLRSFHEWIESGLRRVQSERSSKQVLRGTIPDSFPLEGLPSLAVILDSIWTNAVKFAGTDQNEIRLTTSKTTPLGTPYFKVAWTAPNKLGPHIDRDLIFLRPPNSTTDKHFGFVLLGVHVRLLGGRVVLLENQGQSGFAVQITIPCPLSTRSEL